jgi:hypothetical protein
MNCRTLYYTLALITFISSGLKSQAPGLVVQAGLSSAFSQDKNITPSGQGHYGWVVGVDARLLEGGLYFIMGGQYHRLNLVADSSPNPLNNKDWGILTGRFGLGFNFWRIHERLALRSKLLCSINFNQDFDTNKLEAPYDKVNDSFLGVGTGLGLTLGILEIDLDYQYGVLNAYYKQKDTNFNMISLTGGVRF